MTTTAPTPAAPALRNTIATLAALGAFALRSTAGGIGLVTLIVLPGAAGLLPGAAESTLTTLLPVAALHSLAGIADIGAPDHVGLLHAVVVLAAWLVVGTGAAALVPTRRDAWWAACRTSPVADRSPGAPSSRSPNTARRRPRWPRSPNGPGSPNLRCCTTKAELMSSTMGWLYADLGHQVGTKVAGAPDPAAAVETYVRAMVDYLLANPTHVRLLVEVLTSEELAGAPPDGVAETRRWHDVATLLQRGQDAGQLGTFDPKVVAIVLGGSIDALVAEWMTDPNFDLRGAVNELVVLLRRATATAP